jgi:speckle-type POZ protein
VSLNFIIYVMIILQIFKAHKLILASCSPVFEAMFFGPLAEKQCISISDVEPHVFRSLLQ